VVRFLRFSASTVVAYRIVLWNGINGKWIPLYRALESVSIASALSSALIIYPCQIRVHQGWQFKLQLLTARKEWWPATADSLPKAVTCQHYDTHNFCRPRTHNLSIVISTSSPTDSPKCSRCITIDVVSENKRRIRTLPRPLHLCTVSLSLSLVPARQVIPWSMMTWKVTWQVHVMSEPGWLMTVRVDRGVDSLIDQCFRRVQEPCDLASHMTLYMHLLQALATN